MRIVPLCASAVLAIGTAAALANAPRSIYAGPAGGIAHDALCPKLEAHLKLARFPHGCEASGGAADNLKRILAEPRHVAVGPLDALAQAMAERKIAPGAISILRSGDLSECLFIATRAPGITNWSEFSAAAPRLRLFVAGSGSGSEGTGSTTLSYLRSLDPDGIGKAAPAVIARSGEDAVRRAFDSTEGVAILAEAADPKSPRLTLVREMGGRLLSVTERAFAAPAVAGHKVYAEERVDFATGSWTVAPLRVTTLCSPIAVYSGALEQIAPGNARQEQADLMAAIGVIEKDAFIEKEGRLGRIMKRSRDVSGTSIEELKRMAEEAQARAKPYIDQAIVAGKKAAQELAESAGPMIERAKELSEQTKRELQELIEEFMAKQRK